MYLTVIRKAVYIAAAAGYSPPLRPLESTIFVDACA
jgi:hypothetical protein